MPEDDAELRLIRDQEVRLKRADAFRAPAHLGRRLLARHVEDGAASARCRRARGLGGHVQQQRGLAHAGLTGQEDHRAGDDAAAEDPVQLAHARRARRGPLAVHLADRQGGATRGSRGRARPARGLAGLVDGAPGPALAALSHPLGGGPPALGAAVGDLLFRHALTVTRPALICGSRARVGVVTAALGERTGKPTRPRRRDATAQMHDCGQVLARAEWPWIAARTLFNRLEIFRYLLLSRGFIHRVGRCVSLGWLPIPCADTDNAPYQCAH